MIEYSVIRDLTVKPLGVYMYLPQITWKGDCVGHVGERDTFFWVLEGECFLLIEGEAAIIRPGQLAYLPKGKKRMYTHAGGPFTMYEMAFSAEANGKSLMDILNLTGGNYVVDIENREEMSSFFEKSAHAEMYKNPLYDVEWCANILKIIITYASARNTLETQDSKLFEPVIKLMSASTHLNLSSEELSGVLYMQPTYFIRKFTKTFGMSPQNYFRRLKLFKAMNLLVSTELSMEEVSKQIGIEDSSYFSRFFKKNCGVTPGEFRKVFRR